MRLGIDADFLGFDHQKAGLHNHLVGLLRGLEEVRPRPAVSLFVLSDFPEKATAAREFVATHGFDLPVRVHIRPRTPPYRLKMWAAKARFHLTRLDAFLTMSCLDFPAVRGRVNAALIPDLTTRHLADYHTEYNRTHWEEVFAATRERADLVFTYSEHTRRAVVGELGIPADRVAVVPLAADTAYRPLPADQVAAALHPLGLEPGGYLLTVGTLEPRKNHLTLFRAYADYLRRPGARPVPLVVAGPGGWLDEPIRAEPARLGIAEQVRFVGRVPDLAALYNGAAAAAYLSRYEGFGLPPLEAMACGTPTVTSNVTSMPEVVGDGGLLVDPDDTGGVADALFRVLTDPAVRADLTVRGQKQAARFSWRATAEGYLAAIRRAAQRKRAASNPVPAGVA